jgi:hypothetical protein
VAGAEGAREKQEEVRSLNLAFDHSKFNVCASCAPLPSDCKLEEVRGRLWSLCILASPDSALHAEGRLHWGVWL